jgi:hypothetical protein
VDGSLGPVHPHPVAIVQALGAVAGVDDAGDPELSGDDGRVTDQSADVDDESGGGNMIEAQLGSVVWLTRISPGSTSAKLGSRTTRTVPSTMPALAATPEIAPRAQPRTFARGRADR